MIAQSIVKIAQSYVGQKEISGNKGFRDKTFEAKMKATGWQVGHAWCAYFAELVWSEAYKGSDLLPSIRTLISPSATATYANMQGSSLFKVGSTPRPGALVVWRYGTSWKGHIGIVESVGKGGAFVAIEGNTNAAGGREGIAVARKTRRTGEAFRAKGLNLLGFVYPA